MIRILDGTLLNPSHVIAVRTVPSMHAAAPANRDKWDVEVVTTGVDCDGDGNTAPLTYTAVRKVSRSEALTEAGYLSQHVDQMLYPDRRERR